MQLSLATEWLPPNPVPSHPVKTVVITERDLEIIALALEMKFLSVNEVFDRFFKTTRFSLKAKSDFWTRKRLFQLTQAQFLKVHRLPYQRNTFYTATLKAHAHLLRIKPHLNHPKPHPSIDYRTFIHDLIVLQSRLLLEQSAGVTCWQSERSLQSEPEVARRLSDQFLPDGIYTTAEGKRVAFELEISRKQKKRYTEKIKRFVNLIRAKESSQALFGSVHFVVAQESVQKLLEAETKIYPNLFKVQSLTQFQAQHKNPQPFLQLKETRDV